MSGFAGIGAAPTTLFSVQKLKCQGTENGNDCAQYRLQPTHVVWLAARVDSIVYSIDDSWLRVVTAENRRHAAAHVATRQNGRRTGPVIGQTDQGGTGKY